MFTPCPFSKDYTIPKQQAWFLLKGFYFYRLILSCLLLGLYFSSFSSVIVNSQFLSLYFYSSLSYLSLSGVAIFLISKQLGSYASHAQVLVFSDLICITLIMHACGGISSGLGALMLVSTTAGGVLIGGRCAMLFAAIASLFVFAEQAYNYRVGEFDSADYPYSGMLGAGFFTLAFLAYILAKRTELISRLQEAEITSLEALNQSIIQYMPLGMIITNRQQVISYYNEASCRLLEQLKLPPNLAAISFELGVGFDAWLQAPNKNFLRLTLQNELDLQVQFSVLPTESHHYYMLTLEDVAGYNQRVQQAKLASLGRLTASIAHEIRNPLGAISHAGQLLAEANYLDEGDKRLAAIIQKHSLRINEIIEDILQLSQQRDSHQQRFIIQDWLSEFLMRFNSENKGYQQQFSLESNDISQTIIFDKGHLTQILTNLCENALKYGYVTHKPIKIKLTKQKHRCCIDVIDYGEGIATDNLKYIFEPFFTSSHSGTGLGLYICRELAQLNQATISYHVLDDEQGCYFRLCISNTS